MTFGFFADPSIPPPKAPNNPRNPQQQPDEQEPSVSSEVSDVLNSLLPWVTSLLIHLGIIIIALFIVWSLIQPPEDQPIIPIARLSDNPGGSLSQQNSPDLENTQTEREIQTDSVAIEDSLQELNLDTNTDLELIGLSAGGGSRVAPFGSTTGAATGISARFFGTGGNATRIIYIVDASGSLIDTLPFVIRELKRSISRLSPQQQFNVIFFQAGNAVEVPPTGWKPASGENKQAIADWITLENGNIVPRGSTNPLTAIRLAMRYDPQLVFILSDNITGQGKYEVDRTELLNLVTQYTRNKNIAINSIQFLYPDPFNTLKELAESNGGNYTFISESDLGLN